MKKERRSQSTKKLTASAVLAALGVTFLWLGCIIEPLDLTVTVLASFAVFFAVMEMGGVYPYLIYVVIAVLGFLILPTKVTAFYFAVFGGIYPILKNKFERLKSLLKWILKLLSFNIALTAAMFLGQELLGVPDIKWWYAVIGYAVGSAIFILYDYALGNLINMYYAKIRPRLRINNKF